MVTNGAGQGAQYHAYDMSESWKLKYELMVMDLEEMRRKTQGDPQMHWAHQANVLQHLLEAERDIDRAQCRSEEGLPSEVQGGWAHSRFGCGRIAFYQLVYIFCS
jgi:hypothetical protein